MTKRSSTKPPPRDWVFFTDRDLGNTIPDALRQAGYHVERHDDHFSPTTTDEEWLPIVAERGWVALSHNKKIRAIAAERDAAMRAGLALFFLIGKMPHPDLAKNLVATLPRIIRFREKHEPPFIARVHRPELKFPLGSRPGTVEMALTRAQWERELDAD